MKTPLRAAAICGRPPQHLVAGRWALLWVLFVGTSASRLRLPPKYLLASFPGLRQVNYLQLPDPTWRPLILSGLGSPKAIATDSTNKRLFVVDELARKVVWYRVSVLRSGLLMTDGHQHNVTSAVDARGIALDDGGSLYVAGRYDPGPPAVPVEAILKFSPEQIATSAVPGAVPKPTFVWTAEDSAAAAPSTAHLLSPSAVMVDAVNVYWGNSMRSGKESASVVRAALKAQPEKSEESTWVLANNVDSVSAIVLTASDVYYAAGDKVYGVAKRKTKEMCGESSGCPEVVRKKNGTSIHITSMVWDGEGTIFAADVAGRGIYRFACGSLSTHLMTKVCTGPDVFGLSVFVPVSGAVRVGGAVIPFLIAAVFALSSVSAAG